MYGTMIIKVFTLFSGKNPINVILGMVFGVKNFVKNKIIDGRWKVDVKKLLIIGIPSLLLAIEPFHFALLNHLLIYVGVGSLALIAPAAQPFFGFLIGYVILTSFYKNETV
ncbi:MAG: hypothetical protein ACOWWR_06075 [Eubacteriales bacterium]